MAILLRTTAAVLAACATLAALASDLGPPALFAADDDKPPDLLIGYTEFRTDLPGGRYVNVATRRAVVVKADGTGRRVLAEELTREKGSWTSFGWSAFTDGKTARRMFRNWMRSLITSSYARR